MKIIAWMLTRMILTRFLAVLFGISFFVVSLEVVAYAKEVLELDPNSNWIVGHYMLMRSPGFLATFLPISLLLALLLTITELSYRNELTAIWAAGVSPLRMVIMLLPVAIISGALHFLLVDQGVPMAAPTLKEWGIGDYRAKKRELSAGNPIWMRAGNDILRAGFANTEATLLTDVVIFRRDDNGVLTEQVVAKQASLQAGRWTLSDVVIYYRSNLPPVRLTSTVYSGAFKSAAISARTGDPEEMSFNSLNYFAQNDGFGIRPVWVYQTALQKRISLFLTTLVMVALCVPLATTFRRGGGIGMLFAVGVGLGFLFFVVDGISVSLGELGFVAPWLAAWTPPLAFGALAIFMGLRTENV